MKTIALLSNEHSWTYNLRKETIAALLSEGNRVVLVLPYGEKIELLKDMGCEFIDVPMFERRGKNPINELKLIKAYYTILKEIKPDVILTYTIKPNLYGGIVASKLKIPAIANITGLGSVAEKKGLFAFIAKRLYKFGLKDCKCVFAQNESNATFLIKNNIVGESHIRRINGSGVNLDRFIVSELPNDDICKFVFISRILKEKGIEELLQAADTIKRKYINTEFHICGFCEDEYKGDLDKLQKSGIVIYHGMIDNVPEFLQKMHCLVHPSYYYEGLSNVCLEACASGRAVITTDHEGCRETVMDGVSGFIVPIKDAAKLAKAIEKFIMLSYEEKREMGICGRKHAEANFDRNIIVDAYLEEVHKI